MVWGGGGGGVQTKKTSFWGDYEYFSYGMTLNTFKKEFM